MGIEALVGVRNEERLFPVLAFPDTSTLKALDLLAVELHIREFLAEGHALACENGGKGRAQESLVHDNSPSTRHRVHPIAGWTRSGNSISEFKW